MEIINIFDLDRIFDLERYRSRNFKAILDTTLQNLIILLLILEVTLIPLILSRLTVDSALFKTVYSQTFILIAFALWILRITLRKDLNLIKSPLNIPIFALLIWALLSTLMVAWNKYEALKVLAKFGSYYLLFFIVVDTIRDKYKFYFIIFTWLFTNGIIITYGLMQRFDLDLFKWEQAESSYRILSTFGNSIFYGNYLIFTIPIFILLGIFYSKKILLPSSEPKAKPFRIFFRSLGIIIIFSVIIGISYSFGALIKYVTTRTPGAFNLLSIKLFLIFALVFYILLCFLAAYLFKKHFYAPFFLGFGLIGIYSNILTKSRGSWIGLLAALLLIVFFLIYEAAVYFANKKVTAAENSELQPDIKLKPLIIKYFLIFISGALVVIILFSIVSFRFLPHDIKVRLMDFNLKSTTVKVRMIIMKGALNMIRVKPIFGYGLGSFQVQFPPNRPDDYMLNAVSHNTINAHNEYLQIGAETGIIGIILFFFLIFSYFQNFFRYIWKSNKKLSKHLLLGFAISIFGVLSHSIVSVSMRFTSTGLFFYIFIAFTIILLNVFYSDIGQKPLEMESTKKRTPLFFFIFLIVFIFTVPYFTNQIWKQYKSNFYLRNGVRFDRESDSYKMETNRLQSLTKKLQANPKDRNVRSATVNLYKKFLFYWLRDFKKNILASETDTFILEIRKWNKFNDPLSEREKIEFNEDTEKLIKYLTYLKTDFRKSANTEFIQLYKKFSDHWMLKNSDYSFQKSFSRYFYILEYYKKFSGTEKYYKTIDAHKSNLAQIEKQKGFTETNIKIMSSFVDDFRAALELNRDIFLYKAINQYNNALLTERSCLDAYYKQASNYYQIKKPYVALERYLELQNFALNYTQVHYNKGIIYMNLRAIARKQKEIQKIDFYLNKAQEEFEKSYKLNPYFVPTNLTLTSIYTEKKSPQKSILMLSKLYKINESKLNKFIALNDIRGIFASKKIVEELGSMRKISIDLIKLYIRIKNKEAAISILNRTQNNYISYFRKTEDRVKRFNSIMKDAPQENKKGLKKSQGHLAQLYRILPYYIKELDKYKQLIEKQ